MLSGYKSIPNTRLALYLDHLCKSPALPHAKSIMVSFGDNTVSSNFSLM